MPAYRPVCDENDIPRGEARRFVVEGTEIAVFHVGDAFHATENTCLHAGGPLHEGKIEGTTVTCPWHEWQFDVTTGACGFHGGGLACFPARVVAGKVEVEI